MSRPPAKSDPETKSRTEYRRTWVSKTQPEGYKQVMAYLPPEVHERVTELADQHQERMPIFLGKLVRLAVDHLDLLPPTDPISPPKGPEVITLDLANLLVAIQLTQFPDDTGAARLQQCALVAAIAADTVRGRYATASSVAKTANTHLTQVQRIARILRERGVLEDKPKSVAATMRTGKPLIIRPDAIEALAKAHLEATGAPLAIDF